MMPDNIYDYVKAEETKFESDEIQLGENWFWNLRNHVQLIFHLKNGQFYTGDNDYLRAFKNIMEPMLNLAYWTEDIEVKDVVFFTEGEDDKVLSFLVKKYHDEVYVREHDLDTMFDEITESDLDYGGVLVQDGTDRPEVLPLNSIAFCDQTDMLGGPIAFKKVFSPEKLLMMSDRGWGKPENGATVTLEELVTLASFTKDADGTLTEKQNQTPGKSIEVYVVRGDMPESYLKDGGSKEKFCPQLQVIAYYTDDKQKRQNVTLYRKKDYDNSFLFHTSQKVHGRALGRGTGESLIQPQIWTNFLEIHKTQMLEAGAKSPLYTDDPSFTQKNKIQDMENLEVMKITEGSQIGIVPTINPTNVQLYDRSIETWYQHGQLTASAQDPILGKEGVSGTTFKGQERTVAQGRGLHDRRRGQRAKFIELIYREFILPKIKKELTKGKKFLATLTVEELSWVVDRLATNEANNRIKKAMIEDGKIYSEEEKQMLIQSLKETFSKKGNKHLITILEGELEDIELRMGINIAGKQKDLVNLSDKLLSIFQFVFSNPAGFQAAMQNPALATAFSDILEFSGMSISKFSTLLTPPTQQALPEPAQPQQAQPMMPASA